MFTFPHSVCAYLYQSAPGQLQFAQSRYLVFAQEPLFFFSPDDAAAIGPDFSLLKDATLRHSVTLIGSASYVEPTSEQGKMTIFDIAL